MENGDFHLRKRGDRGGPLLTVCLQRGQRETWLQLCPGNQDPGAVPGQVCTAWGWGAGREPLSSAAAPGVPGAVSEKGWGLWRAQELPSASSRGAP